MIERLHRLLASARQRPRLRPIIEVGEAMAHEWTDDGVRGLAAELAFFGVLSVFPAVLAVAAALGSLDAVAGEGTADRVRAATVQFLASLLTERGSGAVDAVSDLFRSGNTGVLTLSVLAALWAASRGFAAVIRSMAIVYDLEDERPWWRIRLLAIALSIGTVLVVAAILSMLVVGPVLGRGQEVAKAIGLGPAFATAWNWLRLPTALALLIAWAATVFHVSTSHPTSWRSDLPGALLVAVLWVIESAAFRLYLDLAGDGNQVFGVLGGALVVLVWLYLLSAALLLGGELNGILATRASPEHHRLSLRRPQPQQFNNLRDSS